jgi:molybdopterin biosynthesis enzyme MoaB
VFVAGNLLAVTLTVDAPGSPEAVDTAVQIVERALPAIPATIRVIDVTSL